MHFVTRSGWGLSFRSVLSGRVARYVFHITVVMAAALLLILDGNGSPSPLALGVAVCLLGIAAAEALGLHAILVKGWTFDVPPGWTLACGDGESTYPFAWDLRTALTRIEVRGEPAAAVIWLLGSDGSEGSATACRRGGYSAEADPAARWAPHLPDAAEAAGALEAFTRRTAGAWRGVEATARRRETVGWAAFLANLEDHEPPLTREHADAVRRRWASIVEAVEGLGFPDVAPLACGGTCGVQAVRLTWTTAKGFAAIKISLDGGCGFFFQGAVPSARVGDSTDGPLGADEPLPDGLIEFLRDHFVPTPLALVPAGKE